MKLVYWFFIFILIGCAAVDVTPVGILEGKVTIGPLCGFPTDPNNSINPCGLSNTELDAIYGQYFVVLSNENGVTSPLRKKLDRTGLFSFEVEEGNYNIKLETSVQDGLKFSAKASTEKTVKISSKQKVYVELDINTGRP